MSPYNGRVNYDFPDVSTTAFQLGYQFKEILPFEANFF